MLLLLCWTPHLILAYPASIVPDAWAQLKMFWRQRIFTAHHPPFHTWLIGMSTVLGRYLGNVNIGVFLFIIFQAILFAIILVYSFSLMKKMQIPKGIIRVFFIVAIISPYYTQSIGVFGKDTLYSFLFLLYVVEVVYILLDGKQYWQNLQHTVLFIISASAVILLRKNGKYIIYPMLIIIVCVMIKNKFYQFKVLFVRGSIVLILSVLIPIGISMVLTNTYQIQNGSIKEMLSLPFQQTARYVMCHQDDIPEEERQVIDQILDYDSLAEKYMPDISDPIKSTFNKEYTNKQLVDYFKIWAKQFIKDPITYISATVNQNYKIIYPSILEYIRLETYKGDGGEFNEWLGIRENKEISAKEGMLESYYQIMFRVPVLGAFSLLACYNLLLVYSLIYAFYKRCYKVMIVAMPLIITDLVVIAGPVVDIRYAFPIIFSLPVVIAYILYETTLNKSSKEIVVERE